MRLHILEEDIFHENVPNFKIEELQRCLTPPYNMQEAKLNTLELRFASSRTRAWRHLTLATAPSLTLAAFAESLKASPVCDHTSYMVAEPAEVEDEIEWASGRPTSAARAVGGARGKTIPERAWAALTATEQEWLRIYEAKHPHCPATLGQNPDKKPSVGGMHHLQGITAHTHILWNPVVKRWYTPSELGVSMGFRPWPRTDAQGQPVKTTSWHSERATPRNRAHHIKQVGMSMHITHTLLVWLYFYIVKGKREQQGSDGMDPGEFFSLIA